MRLLWLKKIPYRPLSRIIGRQERYGMQIPLAWQMPVSVLGLVLALLFAAGLVRRYQEYKAYQRARLRALLQRIAGLEQALDRLEAIPLSTGLRQTLFDYLHREYLAVQRLNPAYPGIAAQIERMAQQAGAPPGATSGKVPAIEDPAHYQRLLEALDTLAGLLAHNGRQLKQASAHLDAWRREVGERRAEVVARFFIVRAHREQSAGQAGGARTLLHTLLEQLHQRGPDTPFVRELYQEAEALYQRAVRGLPLSEQGNDAAQPTLQAGTAGAA